jgi:hypothetical protein
MGRKLTRIDAFAHAQHRVEQRDEPEPDQDVGRIESSQQHAA